MELKDGYLLPPDLWNNGRFPSFAQYETILRRGRLFYSLDFDAGVTPVGPAIVDRPCNLLYHTANTDHAVWPPGGGWKGFARNERLHGGVDRERKYIASVHAVGVPVIVYQNENNFDSTQFSEGEFKHFAAELEPFVWAFSNPGRRFACTNKPAWRKLLLERLKIRVGEYGADGVFLDNCTPFIHCRCGDCQEFYHNATGGNLLIDMGRPETVVADMRVFDYIGPSQLPKDLVPVEDPATMRYLEWRIERAIDFYRELRRQVEAAIGRRIIYTSNGHIGIAEQTAISISGVFDMVFSEDGFTAPPKSNAFGLRLGSALLEGRGCPFVITRVTESAPVPDMASILAAEGRALGGQADFWDINYRTDANLARAARDIRNFHRRHADSIYAVEEDFNDVAILYSWRSDLWTSAADSPAKMAASLLEDLNQPFDILLAERPQHVRKIDDYKLLIVPHLEVLSDEWFEAIRKFLDAGGHVVSTGATAQRDEHLHKRDRRWSSPRWRHFEERVEKQYARSRKPASLHSGFERPAGPWPVAIDEALPQPSLRLEPLVPMLSINRTRLPGGEAIHLVNRYCNVFPHIRMKPRPGIVLHLSPARPVGQILWMSPEAGNRVLEWERIGSEMRIALPTLHVAGIVHLEYAS